MNTIHERESAQLLQYPVPGKLVSIAFAGKKTTEDWPKSYFVPIRNFHLHTISGNGIVGACNDIFIHCKSPFRYDYQNNLISSISLS